MALATLLLGEDQQRQDTHVRVTRWPERERRPAMAICVDHNSKGCVA
jgi:hypothetical protein